MNTFWLKVAVAAVVIVVIIIAVSAIIPSGSKPEPPTPTFYDVAAKDRQKYLTPPERLDSNQEQTASSSGQPVAEGNAPVTAQANQPPEPPKKVTLYFSEMSEIDKIEAERLLNVAVPGYSIGRLPITGYSLAVQTCRQITQRWPDSWYAYRSRQMLAAIPERFHERYKITPQEVDLSMYSKQRPNTVPYVEEKR
jgi:hypothetical protein